MVNSLYKNKINGQKMLCRQPSQEVEAAIRRMLPASVEKSKERKGRPQKDQCR